MNHKSRNFAFILGNIKNDLVVVVDTEIAENGRISGKFRENLVRF